MSSTRVVLDTNFLLIPGNFKIDIFSELKRIIPDQIELYIIDNSVKELEKIIETGSGKDKAAAKLGLMLIKQKGINLIKGCKNLVDEDIIELSKDENTVICTQDKELKQKIKKPVVVLRQKSHLELI